MRAAQLKCLAWTFSAFLPKENDGGDNQQDDNANNDNDDYYHLLSLTKSTATPDAIRRAYKKKSLQLHPDKIAQRSASGNKSDEEIRRDFQKVKEAYDTLSDPKKKGVYDALGPVGMKVMTNPSAAMDPHVLLDNLSKSTCCDKTKLFGLVFGLVGLCLLQPILICAKVDQDLRGYGALSEAGWVLILLPLWILNFVGLVAISTIARKRPAPFVKLLCATVLEIFLAVKWDGVVSWPYAIVLIPLYLLELVRIVDCCYWISKIHRDVGRMVTMEYLEEHILAGRDNEQQEGDGENGGEDGGGEGDEEEGGRKAASASEGGAAGPYSARLYADLTEEERDEINEEYIIVHSPPTPPHVRTADEDDDDDMQDEIIASSPEYQAAMSVMMKAYATIRNIVVIHTVTIVLLIVKADGIRNYSWWVVSVPLWIQIGLTMGSSCLTCFTAGAAAGGGDEELVVVMDDGDDDGDDDDDDNDDDDNKGGASVRDGGGGKGDGGRSSEEGPLVPPPPAAVAEAASTPTAAAAAAAASAEAAPSKGGTGSVDGGQAREKQEKDNGGGSAAVAEEKFSEEEEKQGKLHETKEGKGTVPDIFELVLVEEVRSMKVKEIKQELERRRVSTVGVFEKEELVQLLVKSRREEMGGTSNSSGGGEAHTSASVGPSHPFPSSSPGDSSSSSSSGVYIDEETFRAWQSAQAEDEAKASEIAAKACGNCCLQLFYVMMLALFVAKLAGEDVGTDAAEPPPAADAGASSYSAFWILFPILLFAGVFLCCCCCSIYCASGVEGLEENVKHMATATAAKGKDGGGDEEAPEGPGGGGEAEAAEAVGASAVDQAKDDSAGKTTLTQTANVEAGKADDAQSNASDDLD